MKSSPFLRSCRKFPSPFSPLAFVIPTVVSSLSHTSITNTSSAGSMSGNSSVSFHSGSRVAILTLVFFTWPRSFSFQSSRFPPFSTWLSWYLLGRTPREQYGSLLPFASMAGMPCALITVQDSLRSCLCSSFCFAACHSGSRVLSKHSNTSLT